MNPIDDDLRDDPDFDEHKPSRSQRKREAHALHDLGEHLAGLPDAVFKRLLLPDDLRTALLQARELGRGGARVRQLRYVAKLLRRDDGTAAQIAGELAAWQAGHDARTRLQHRVEQWVQALLQHDATVLDTILQACPTLDAAAITSLVERAGAEYARKAPPASRRALFRLLRTALETAQGLSP